MKIPTNPYLFFHQALGLVQAFPPYNKLTKKELQILGEMMKYKHLGYKPTLNNITRGMIAKDLEISKESFRNFLSSIRGKGLIVDNEVPDKYLITYLQPFNFEFYEKD
jgi:hypothetical protein